MANERTFNFNDGCNVTFNDIHDNDNCTIYTAQQEQPTTANVAESIAEEPQTAVSSFFRTDKNKLEDCQKQLNEIIITSKNKQNALKQICSAANSIYFNPNTFTHKGLADELNQLQSKYNFTKDDVDAAYRKR